MRHSVVQLPGKDGGAILTRCRCALCELRSLASPDWMFRGIPLPRNRLLALLAIVVTLASCGPDNNAPTGEPQCGTVPYRSNTGNVTPDPIIDSPQVWNFISEPSLHQNKVTINVDEPGTSSGLIFVDPFTPSSVAVYGQPGALILDNNGTPFWFRPLSSPNLMINDFRMCRLPPKPTTCGMPII